MNPFRKLLMHALAMAVPLCTWAQDTESESNNSTGVANPLSYGVSMTGSMGACSPTDNSADFFVTTFPSQGVLRVQSSMSTTGASPVNVTFRVLSSGGSLLGTFPLQAGASGVAVNDEFRFTCRGQGLHYIEVQFPGGAQCINYTFTYDIVAPVFANDAESNNSTGTAVPIAVNTWSPGQVNFTPGDNNDYFRLDLPTNGVLNIEWEGEHAGTADPSTATLQLLTSGGSLLQTWTVPVGANSLPATDLVGILCRGNTNFYFLRVFSNVCGTSYRFRYNVAAPLFANDAESNNSTGTATAIPVNTFTEGQIDFYYGDNDDYYRLDLPNNGVLRVDVEAEHAGAGVGELLTVQLLSNGGSLLQTWTAPVGANGAAASSVLSMTCRGDQSFYFLRITSGVCGASYRFRYRVDAPIFNNDVESNNGLGQATTLPIGTETQGQINFHYGDNTDTYRVDLPGNGILNVQWQAEHAGATAGQTATIQLLSSNGSQLQTWTLPVGSDGIPETANVSITCRGNTNHYFLNIASGICGTSYKLSYTLTPPIYGINPAAGSGLGDAPTIDLNAANVEGQLNFYQGPTDAYYRIVLSATTDLSIGFLAEHAAASNGNFTARLLSSGGSLLLDQTILAGANSSPVTSTANYGSRAAGTYFIRLFGAPCGTSYRLLCNDDDEDGVCNASDLCPGTPNGEGINSNGCACSQLTVDDGDPCTLDACTNGIVSNTFQDADNDGTCDANDGCPNDPNKIVPGECGCGVPDTDSDGDGLADCVDPCPALANLAPGDACDDGNANTINDVVNAGCVCAGTLVSDDCEGTPGGSALPGTPCDDGDATTGDDTWDANCNCVGLLIDCLGFPGGAELPGTPCDDGAGSTFLDTWTADCICQGLTADCEGNPGGSALPGSPCDDGDPNTINDTWDFGCTCIGWQLDCEGVAGGNALPGTPCDDNDPLTINDTWSFNCICVGSPLSADCEGTPGGSALPGTPCDDGDATTGDDTWDANCNCVGLLIDCLGFPGGTELPGTPCDDGAGSTFLDTWTADCICQGLTADCEGNPGGSALPGSPCDDGDPNTINDTWDFGCTCIGWQLDCEGVAGGNALPGTPCDDNDPLTINDTWSTNCACVGTPLTADCEGTPGGSALPGTPCDDGDATTGDDTWDANCACVGQLIDCLGVAGGSALPGTACDDNDPLTINDTWSTNCACVGTPLTADCEGTPGGSALPGTPCDDGDATTGDDTWDANCVCVGQLIDCLGVAGGSALPGTACDDNDPFTINDTWSANCTCEGTPIGNCTELLTLDITLDANGAQTDWELFDETGTVLIASGGPYANGTPGAVITETLCLNQLCYRLVVNDGGANGITGGGYLLRDAANRAILNANGLFTTASSAIMPFCLPLSNQGLINSSCGRTDLLYANTTQIYASAQPGASGYQFWIFDPHGSYNRRVFIATQNLKPTTLATNPVPADLDLNVRVRALVGGVYTNFGRACVIRLNNPGSASARGLELVEESSMEFHLFPNPSRAEVVNLAVSGFGEMTAVQLEVIDLFGKRVHAEQFTVSGEGHIQALDLKDLATGMYIVNLRAGEMILTQRLVRH